MVMIEATTHFHAGHDGQVCALAVSPNSLCVVTASLDRTIIVWDTGNRQIFHQWLSSCPESSCLASSPDSQYLLYGGGHKTLTVRHLSPNHPHRPTTVEGPCFDMCVVSRRHSHRVRIRGRRHMSLGCTDVPAVPSPRQRPACSSHTHRPILSKRSLACLIWGG
ncbi:hypothetical protein LXA43DRAFT_678517 [Ganoderma leucocontextum]|nr:hypothetical protein LXA43DRAFT_678517 [Ganoderma leucocontextum]